MLYIEEHEGTSLVGRTLDLDNSFSWEDRQELRALSEANKYAIEMNKKVKYAPRK